MSWVLQEAKQQLLVMVGVLRELDVGRKGGHTAAADMAYLYAMTQVWFTVERNYKVCMPLPATACTPIPYTYGRLSALPQGMLPCTVCDLPTTDRILGPLELSHTLYHSNSCNCTQTALEHTHAPAQSTATDQ